MWNPFRRKVLNSPEACIKICVTIAGMVKFNNIDDANALLNDLAYSVRKEFDDPNDAFLTAGATIFRGRIAVPRKDFIPYDDGLDVNDPSVNVHVRLMVYKLNNLIANLFEETRIELSLSKGEFQFRSQYLFIDMFKEFRRIGLITCNLPLESNSW